MILLTIYLVGIFVVAGIVFLYDARDKNDLTKFHKTLLLDILFGAGWPVLLLGMICVFLIIFKNKLNER